MTFKRASVNLARILVLALCVVPCAWSQSSTEKKPDPGTKPAVAKAGKPAPAQAAKPGAEPGPGSAAKPAAAPKSTHKAAAKRAGKGKVGAKQSAGSTLPGGAPNPAGAGPREKSESESASRRDPFIPLVSQDKGGGAGNLPPGKAGLVVGTVRVDGTVRSQGSMIAVVTNPEQRVYFIRQGDHLYDGDVEKIDMDGVTFRVNSKDAFGRPIERVITKRIYAKAGEQQ
jgi:hypothetical protein